MTLSEALKQLKALGSAKVRAQNAKSGAGENQFGVSLGDIRVLAKKFRADHALALALWDTGNVDAQFLATLLVQPKQLSAKELDRMVRSITFVRVADWLNAYHACSNRNPLPQTPQAGHRHRREAGNLPGLSRVAGLHVPLRPDLDQCHGEPARLRGHRRDGTAGYGCRRGPGAPRPAKHVITSGSCMKS